MIAEQEAEGSIRADGETRCSSKIIFRDDVVLHFVVIADIDRRDPVDGGLDLLAIAIIDETRGNAIRILRKQLKSAQIQNCANCINNGVRKNSRKYLFRSFCELT